MQTPRSSHRVSGRSHPGVTESQSVHRPVAPRTSHATAGRRNLRGADRQEHHPREGRPAIREDAQPQAPPAGLRRKRRAFVGRCGHQGRPPGRAWRARIGMVNDRRWWFEGPFPKHPEGRGLSHRWHER